MITLGLKTISPHCKRLSNKKKKSFKLRLPICAAALPSQAYENHADKNAAAEAEQQNVRKMTF
jgi:hypothetical protein